MFRIYVHAIIVEKIPQRRKPSTHNIANSCETLEQPLELDANLVLYLICIILYLFTCKLVSMSKSRLVISRKFMLKRNYNLFRTKPISEKENGF